MEVLIQATIVLAFFIGIVVLIVRHLRWLSVPTLRQYLQENPSCKTPNGIRCNVCNANSIRNWGLNSADSSLRVFICNHCGTRLYRR